MLVDIIAAWIALALVAYTVSGGADFGGGMWDLFAYGPRAAPQRAAIVRAMGPVWEANHVWLIFIIVMVFSAFPHGFAALAHLWFIPGHVVLLGIILRGSGFSFYAHAGKWWSRLFGAMSLLTPLLLGMALGVVADGSIDIHDGTAANASAAWLAPVPLLMGILAVVMCAFLAAVYLANETTGEVREDFRQRACWSLSVLGLIGLGAVGILPFYAPHLADGLSHRHLALTIVAGLAALTTGVALIHRRYRLAQVSAIIFAGFVIAACALAHYPYFVYPHLTLLQVAANHDTLLFLAWTIPIGLALVLPALWWLLRIFKSTPQ